MYEKIVIILLLSGYVSTQESTVTEVATQESPSYVSTQESTVTEVATQESPSARKQIVHIFSEPVIIGIIYAVMLGIIITILSFTFCIGLLTKKSSLPVQYTSPEITDSEVL